MRRCVLFALALLGALPLPAQQPAKGAYRCLPCGSACDTAQYAGPGTCAHCGMRRVPASGIRFRTIAPEAVCDSIARQPRLLLLDVRTPAEYAGVTDPPLRTLKGAINIPIAELPHRLAELRPYRNREVLVFCSHSHRSPQAAYLLTQNGFRNVVNLAGGLSVLHDTACRQ